MQDKGKETIAAREKQVSVHLSGMVPQASHNKAVVAHKLAAVPVCLCLWSSSMQGFWE